MKKPKKEKRMELYLSLPIALVTAWFVPYYLSMWFDGAANQVSYSVGGRFGPGMGSDFFVFLGALILGYYAWLDLIKCLIDWWKNRA